MATKKPATKKPTTRKAPAKAAAKKAPVRRATTVRTSKAASSDWELPSGGKFTSFKRANSPNFFRLRITDQTVYWAILCFIVLALGIWVISINDKVQRIYDQIDQQNESITSDGMATPKKQ